MSQLADNHNQMLSQVTDGAAPACGFERTLKDLFSTLGSYKKDDNYHGATRSGRLSVDFVDGYELFNVSPSPRFLMYLNTVMPRAKLIYTIRPVSGKYLLTVKPEGDLLERWVAYISTRSLELLMAQRAA